MTVKAYDKIVHEVTVVAREAKSSQNLKVLEIRLATIAAQVPHGKPQLAPIWKHQVQPIPGLPGVSEGLREKLVTTLRDVVADDVALGLLHVKGPGSKGLADLASSRPAI